MLFPTHNVFCNLNVIGPLQHYGAQYLFSISSAYFLSVFTFARTFEEKYNIIL